MKTSKFAFQIILPLYISSTFYEIFSFINHTVDWKFSAGKSLSEALIFALSNPQYNDRLFIVHENCKLRIPAEHVVYTNCCFCSVLTFRTILVHNMFCRCCELLKKIYLYQLWRIEFKIKCDFKWTLIPIVADPLVNFWVRGNFYEQFLTTMIINDS